MPLTRATVLQAALKLLNEVGIDALTTRKLAERLGVQSPALYWHFKNKRDLLDEIAVEMLNGMQDSEHPAEGQDWSTWIAAHARDFRRVLLAHRDGARLHVAARPAAAHLPNIEEHFRILCGAGFSPRSALLAQMAIGRFVVGWVLEEQADQGKPRSLPRIDAQTYPLLAQGAASLKKDGFDAAFEFGLRALIDGFVRQLKAERKAGL